MIYTDEIINNPVKLSHYLIENRVENNIRACDMTAGNGNDSKFILDKKNPKILYAFDIQKYLQTQSLYQFCLCILSRLFRACQAF